MYSITQIIIICIVIGAVWAIFNTVVELPPGAKRIANIIIVAVRAILAIKVLVGVAL